MKPRYPRNYAVFAAIRRSSLPLRFSSTAGPRNSILPENAVRKYGGRELAHRMLGALDRSGITPWRVL